jgi:glycosyltransferase involved in cell wall biosynthesis
MFEMRVLMVSPTFSPITGGAETVINTFSRQLANNGVNVEIMTFSMEKLWEPRWKGRTEKLDNITIHKIAGLDWLPFAHSPRINLQINLIPARFTYLMKKCDIIHFHQAEFSFPLFSFSVRKPKILHLHGVRLSYFRRYHLSRLLLQKTANLYLSLSRQMQEDLVTLGIPEDKTAILPNPVDISEFCPGKKNLSNIILYVGRMTPDKGLHVLLESLRYVKTPISLKIIGPAPKIFELTYFGKILELIRNENVKSKHKIDYLGTVEKKVLVRQYQEASVLVLPSLYEPFAVVILEALACGTPVIATMVGGIPEIIRNYETGILVPSNNPLRLAEAIDYLMENKDIRDHMGNAGRKFVVETYAMEILVKRLLAIYEKLLNN